VVVCADVCDQSFQLRSIHPSGIVRPGIEVCRDFDLLTKVLTHALLLQMVLDSQFNMNVMAKEESVPVCSLIRDSLLSFFSDQVSNYTF